ncbi:hypothetical protein VTN77DRAFT_1884 [Rasamsonia byssochlamydoides]|uniref:uncharacterized protein n=1 Tax=Rasamsonia byssochlamydoides TaxID=89139 RepID=UPI00374206FC
MPDFGHPLSNSHVDHLRRGESSTHNDDIRLQTLFDLLPDVGAGKGSNIKIVAGAHLFLRGQFPGEHFCMPGTDGQDHCATVKGALGGDDSKQFGQRQPGRLTILDVLHVGLHDLARTVQPVSCCDGRAVIREEFRRRREIVLSIALVDLDFSGHTKLV